jgi:predicted phosphodiesterase
MRTATSLVAVYICLVLCFLVSPSGAEVVSVVPDPSTVSGGGVIPYVTGTTYNSTVIRWYAENVTPDTLRYANESFFISTGTYDRSIVVNKTFFSPMISLTNLEPGTRYHYILQSDTIAGNDSSFLTLPENGSCSFIVYGDTREQAPYFTQLERHKIVADRIATEPNISFVVNTGDLVNNPDDYEEWDRFFSAGKTLFGTTTYVVVRGNHDSNLSFLEDLFGTVDTYSLDCGDIHIAILDSNDFARHSIDEQARWLIEDLTSTDKWKIVILHHPIYTSEENHFGGFENLKKSYEPVFLLGNVSVVFNGHVHAYERIEKSGITYITEGRGGAPAYPLNETKMEGSVRSLENSLGYSRMTINPESKSLDIDVIQVADVSPDLRNVSRIYPVGTYIDHVELKKPGNESIGGPVLSPRLPLLSDAFRCNSTKPSGYQILFGQFHFCNLSDLSFLNLGKPF